MSDAATPNQGAGRGVIDFGNGFVADFSDFVGTETDLLEDDREARENASLEGERKTDAPEKPALEDEPEKPAEPQKPAEPEVVKATEDAIKEYKIKYRGEELVEKLTDAEVIARIQMAKDYEVRKSELQAKKQELAAVEKIAATPWFKEQYEEAIRTGVIEAPAAPSAPDPRDEYEYAKRQGDSDFEEVRAKMREYALTLPEPAQQILQSNHKVFIDEYDRFAALVRKKDKEPERPVETQKVDPSVTKKILQSKEVAKAQAVVEKPGVASPEVDPSVEIRKRVAAIRREAKDGSRGAVERLAYFSLYGKLPEF